MGLHFSIWIADLITKYGVGNGSSLIIAIGITAAMPAMFQQLGQEYLVAQRTFGSVMIFVSVILYITILLGVVYLEIAKRKVPIQYANRQGKSDSNIPIKLNSAGSYSSYLRFNNYEYSVNIRSIV